MRNGAGWPGHQGAVLRDAAARTNVGGVWESVETPVKTRSSLTALAAALVVTLPAAAHHSFAAQYDSEKPVTVSGVVTKVEWLNPHARFYVDVKDDAGTVNNWEWELASPNGLMRLGFTRNTLKSGDEITVFGFRARDGSFHGNTRSVTRANGEKVFAGDGVQGGLQ